MTDLKDYIKTLFDGVSAHRFRDVSEEIRAAVIEGIGNWTTMLPSDFLQDSYLKYIAWALSDKVGLLRICCHTPDAWIRMKAIAAKHVVFYGTGCRYVCCYVSLLQDAIVRETAASALLELYVGEDNISPLHEFTNRFSTRFLELIYDKDEGVAVKGVCSVLALYLRCIALLCMLTSQCQVPVGSSWVWQCCAAHAAQSQQGSKVVLGGRWSW